MDLVEDFNRYYVISFFTHNLTSRIPIRKITDLGLRKTMSEEKISKVFKTLQSLPRDLPDHFKHRKIELEQLAQSGKPLKIAQLVRELTWRKSNKKLSPSESKMLSTGRDMLVKEIALVTDNEKEAVSLQIDQALEISVEAKEKTLVN